METLDRTNRYSALLEQRRSTLRTQLDKALVGGKTLIWELGCGHGHFLAAYAQAHPDMLCIGVDIVGERIERALRKRDRARLTNLHFFHAEARLFLETLPAETRIAATFILFPDPWPKLRHRKHRILQPAFLDALAKRTIRGGRLYFRTDFEPYFTHACDTINAHPVWRPRVEAWPFEFETVFQSRAPTYQSLCAEVAS